MERKNYLLEDLSNEEKKYLKKIIITTKYKYIQKNYDYINFKLVELNEEIQDTDDDIVVSVFEKCKKELHSAEKFQDTLENSILYKYVKALSLRERTVLFYLFWEGKNISEIARIMEIDRKTARKIRDESLKKLAKTMMGGNENV